MLNFGELLDRLLASFRSTSAATQQIAGRELKSSLMQHKQELESQIIGLKSEVGNLRQLLISCLNTGETLACSIQQRTALSRECLLGEQKHLEQIKLLTLNVNGVETEVKRYYDNMQSLLTYLGRNQDNGWSDNDKAPSVNGIISMETPVLRKIEPGISADNLIANAAERKMPIKHVHFAADNSSTFSKTWVNPVWASNGSGKSIEDVVFAEDLPGPARVRLDDDRNSSFSETSAVATSVFEPPCPTGRAQMPVAILDTCDFGNANGTWSPKMGRTMSEKTQLSSSWSANMRDCKVSPNGMPRSGGGGIANGSMRTSYPPPGGEKAMPKSSQRTYSPDRKCSVSFRVKPDSARPGSTPDHCGTMETLLPRFRAPLHRANSERCPSVFDKSKRHHSISPRAGMASDENSSSVTVIQLGGTLKSARHPTTSPILPNHVRNSKEMVVRKPSASLHKVILSLDEVHARTLSPRSPRDTVATHKGTAWSSRQGRPS